MRNGYQLSILTSEDLMSTKSDCTMNMLEESTIYIYTKKKMYLPKRTYINPMHIIVIQK